MGPDGRQAVYVSALRICTDELRAATALPSLVDCLRGAAVESLRRGVSEASCCLLTSCLAR